MNPIALKELRQAVRSKLVASLFMLFLLFLLGVTVLVIVSELSDSYNTDYALSRLGMTILLWLTVALQLTTLLFVPLYVAVRMALERDDLNLDLQFITALTPGMVVRGKMIAGTALAGVFFAAAAPFMALTYLLRGIDIIAVFIMLASAFGGVVLLMQASVVFASLSLSKVVRILLSIPMLFGVLFAAFLLTVLNAAGLDERAFSLQQIDWNTVAALAGVWATTMGLGYTLSIAFLLPHSANRALSVRVFGIAAITIWGVLLASFKADEDTVRGWYNWLMAALSLAAIFAICERETYGARLQRQVPRAWLCWLAFPFFSGAANALVWVILAAALVCALFHAMLLGQGVSMQSEPMHFFFLPMQFFFLYVLAYTLLTLLVWRGAVRRRIPQPFIWLLPPALCIVGTLLPVVISPDLYTNGETNGLWQAGNLFTLGDTEYAIVHTYAGIGAVVLLLVLNGLWLLARVRAFVPPPANQEPAQ